MSELSSQTDDVIRLATKLHGQNLDLFQGHTGYKLPQSKRIVKLGPKDGAELQETLRDNADAIRILLKQTQSDLGSYSQAVTVLEHALEIFLVRTRNEKFAYYCNLDEIVQEVMALQNHLDLTS